MRAIFIDKPGGPEVLVLRETAAPEPGFGQVRVRVHATAVNRADVVQRKGFYPAPADAPADIPGLEFAGEVEKLGAGVDSWQIGQRVFGLCGGGSYAEYLTVPAGTLATIPDNLSYVQAAAVPEAFITAYDAAVVQGGLCAGRTLLISAVGSGVGTAAVQIARAIGAFSIGTARSQGKLDSAYELGLNKGLLAPDGLFAQSVLALTEQAGVDVVLELVGGKYVVEDIICAASQGRIILVGLVGGAKVETDLATVLRKRLTIKGTTLRMRPLAEKIAAGQLLARNLAPLFAVGQLKAVVDQVLPLEQAAAAHALMEANENFGKIVLTLA